MHALDCSVIDGLPPRERIRLLDRAVPRSLSKSQPLFLAGERAERVYVVTEGLLKLCARDANGSDTILGLAAPGELAGDMGVLEGAHPYDGIAAARCSVLALDGELFTDVVTGHAPTALELARSLAERWHRMGEVALERTTGEVPVRLAGRLLELAEICGHMRSGTIEMELPLAQEDLGRLAGMCRESTCKALRRFKKAGVVDYRGRKLSILRPDVLQKIRCAERVSAPFR